MMYFITNITFKIAAQAENDDNVSEQKRQLGKRVRYGEVIQVSPMQSFYISSKN